MKIPGSHYKPSDWQGPKWHPLIAGNDRAMEEGGYAVADWAISDQLVTADVDFIVRIKASES